MSRSLVALREVSQQVGVPPTGLMVDSSDPAASIVEHPPGGGIFDAGKVDKAWSLEVVAQSAASPPSGHIRTVAHHRHRHPQICPYPYPDEILLAPSKCDSWDSRLVRIAVGRMTGQRLEPVDHYGD